MMAKGRSLPLLLVLCLLANAFSAPTDLRWRRDDNEIESKEDSGKTTSTAYPSSSTTEDDDEDFSDSTTAAPSGSNLFSLLRLAGALVPTLSASNQQKIISNPMLQKFIHEFTKSNQKATMQRRQGFFNNEIEIDDTIDLKPPPLQRQETEESHEDSSESDETDDDNGAEVESHENDNKGNDNKENGNNENGNGDNDKQDSDSNGTGESDDDSDEPESDGQGGGVLGLLAGLSGGEDGQSDLGSLLAAVSGIVANLSGDGIDLNALIASGLGLFVGLLSEGEENPGAVLGGYLLTSLDSLSGGGANNNGAFFGNFISKLVKGTSASDPSASEPPSPLWTLKMDILRAVLQFGTSLLGLASSSSSAATS